MSTANSRDSDDDAIPAEDTSEATKLFNERLAAWKHACGYLEDYISATQKMHHSHGKEYEKVLKTVSKPLKEGNHFDQNIGGIAGFFDNMRSNTQGIANSHEETAKTIKGSVLPTFERLHAEIKSKSKELVKGAGKGSKAVDKARNATQKHIELLGQHSATYDSTGGKVGAHDDPYVIQRGIFHRLHRQVIEENANRQDILAVQSNFASFEAHVIETIQNGMAQFNSIVSKQADLTKSMYGDIVASAQRIPGDFEWNSFLHRNTGVLIDPEATPRSVESINFPNQHHRATIPLISGSLDRRTKLLRKYETGYYVVTASKYLHEFKTDDDVAKDPVPEISLYLPDCVVGQIDGDMFAIKGKDVSKGKMGIKMSTNSEYKFKGHTHDSAEQWWEIIRAAAGQVTNEVPSVSAPTSPVVAHSAEGEKFGTIASAQESGTTAAPAATHPTPTEAAPVHAAAPATSAEPAFSAAPPTAGADEKAAEAARHATHPGA
ncbi:PH domain-containing protein [Microthyrium microscopicum]|uniref:PH domain-containing protein n=1 Tax=Microthyrium microscopicum TaxID=703497 RepID=A0A6A6UF98_9PEZI|nr:PH domain-containing protein [Microthyrium microscopicum]